MRIANMVKNGILLLVSIFLFCIIAELVCRVKSAELMPRYRFDMGKIDFSSQGFRGKRIYSTEKAKDTIRIMGLGDSFTYGQYVAEDKVYLALLEGILSGADPKHRYEVMNGGHPAYNLVDEFNFFINNGKQFSPDIVIIGVTCDDMNLGNFNPPQIFPRIEKYFERSYFYSFLRYKYISLLDKLSGRIYERIVIAPYSYEGLSFTHAIGLMKKLCSERNIKLVIVILPYTDWVEESCYPLEVFNSAVKAICAGYDVDLLDMTPFFYDYARRNHLKARDFWVSIKPPDGHPNILAHKMISEVLFQFLEQKGMIGNN